MQHKSKLTIENFSSKVDFANVTLSATLQTLSLQAISVVSTRTSTLGWKEAVITQMLCLVTSGWNFPYLLLVSLGPGWADCSNIFLFVSGSPRRRAACTQCESFSHPHPESLSLVGMFLVGRPQRMHFFLTMGFENSFLPVKVHSPAVVYELEQKKQPTSVSFPFLPNAPPTQTHRNVISSTWRPLLQVPTSWRAKRQNETCSKSFHFPLRLLIVIHLILESLFTLKPPHAHPLMPKRW